MLKKMISFVAVVGMVLALAPAAQAATIDVSDPLVTTLGLSAGKSFHMVFVTSLGISGLASDNIDHYNQFVDNVANNVTVSDSIVAEYNWTWKVIGSTQYVHAIDNTSTSGIGFPIYLVGGGSIPVVDEYGDLWDGDIDNSISRTQSGLLATNFDATAWTGTQDDGLGYPNQQLGFPRSFNNVRYGTATSTDGTWVDKTFIDARGDRALYAFSETILVVPEPASAVLLLIGAPLLALRRRRK